MEDESKNSDEFLDSLKEPSIDKSTIAAADKSHNVEFLKDVKEEPEPQSDEKQIAGNDGEEESVDNDAEEPVESEEVDDVVDEIVNEESDQLLELEDEKRENRFEPPKENRSLKAKISHLVKLWWQNKRLRYGSLVGLFLVLCIMMFVPTTRYGMLNISGVRVQSSMTVVDSKSGLPLKNIRVMIQGKENVSNDEGVVAFSGLKLGRTKLSINKIGYASYEKSLTLGWGSNPIGPQPLMATGTEFTLVASDWLSGQAILGAEATSGENTAKSDDSVKNGIIVLNVGEINDDTTVKISADGYRTEEVPLSDVTVDYAVKMVPAKKHVFVSNRDGRYDLYKIDVDGQNEQLLLAATGKEREIPFVLPHPTKDSAAYITSRDGEQNPDKFVLDGLYIVESGSGDSAKERKVTRSEQLQLIGWSKDKLVYVAVVEGVSAGNSQRSKIFSYDINSGDKTELASANYFNDVKLINDIVYYSVSGYAVPASAAKLFTVKPDGTDKKTLVDAQVWSILRSGFDTVLFNAADQQWFEQKAGGGATKVDQAPSNYESRIYVASPDGRKALWTDIRDGKGVLLNYDIESKQEEILYKESGVESPVYWLSNNYIVFRIFTNEETADYVMNLDGGEPRKISDVLGNRSRYFY